MIWVQNRERNDEFRKIQNITRTILYNDETALTGSTIKTVVVDGVCCCDGSMISGVHLNRVFGSLLFQLYMINLQMIT